MQISPIYHHMPLQATQGPSNSSDLTTGEAPPTLVAHVLVGNFAIGVTGELWARPGAWMK